MKSVSDLGAEFTIDNGIADRKVVNDKLANAHINLVGMEQDQAIAFCNGKNLHMPSLDEIKTGGYMKGDFLEKLKRPHDMEYWTSDAKDDAGNFIVVRPDGSIVPSWQPNARGGVFTSNAKHYFFCY